MKEKKKGQRATMIFQKKTESDHSAQTRHKQQQLQPGTGTATTTTTTSTPTETKRITTVDAAVVILLVSVGVVVVAAVPVPVVVVVACVWCEQSGRSPFLFERSLWLVALSFFFFYCGSPPMACLSVRHGFRSLLCLLNSFEPQLSLEVLF